MPRPDKLKPGQFWARCALTKPHPIHRLPEYLRREYEERGWKKGFREVRIGRADRHVECFLEPLCDGFETTDKAAFEAHMKDVHGRTFTNWSSCKGENASLVNRAKGKWRTPPAGREGAPLKKSIVEATVACDGCGLVMEQGSNYAGELFLREHLELCVSQAGAA